MVNDEWWENTNHNPFLTTTWKEIELCSLIEPLYEHQDQFIRVFLLVQICYTNNNNALCSCFMSKITIFFFFSLSPLRLHCAIQKFHYWCNIKWFYYILCTIFFFTGQVNKRASDERKYVTDVLLPNSTTMEDFIRFQS